MWESHLSFYSSALLPRRREHPRYITISSIVSIGFNWGQLVSSFEIQQDCWCWPLKKKVLSAAHVDELFTGVDGTSPLLFTYGWRAVMWHGTCPDSLNRTFTYKDFALCHSCVNIMAFGRTAGFSGDYYFIFLIIRITLIRLLFNSMHVEDFSYLCTGRCRITIGFTAITSIKWSNRLRH